MPTLEVSIHPFCINFTTGMGEGAQGGENFANVFFSLICLH
jgi:hypothetical protein